MTEKPLVSIVVPIFNMGTQLRNAAKYIMAQTYENIEIILVDDGSEDDTPEVCRELAGKDERVTFFRQENMGSGPARNKGIENASGEYIYFADADDEMSENLIERIVERMEKGDCDMAVFGFKRIFKDGSEKEIRKLNGCIFDGDEVRCEYHKFYGNNSLTGIQGAPWNKMFRLGLIKKYGIKYPPLRRHQDEVFIMRYVDKMRRVVFIDDVLYLHNTNDREQFFKKIPENYFEIVSNLNTFRMKYIYGWNKDNIEMLDIICRDFVYDTGLALMFSFNPKWRYSFLDRYRVIKGISKRFSSELPDRSYNAHSTMFTLMKNRRYVLLYAAAFLGLKKYY